MRLGPAPARSRLLESPGREAGPGGGPFSRPFERGVGGPGVIPSTLCFDFSCAPKPSASSLPASDGDASSPWLNCPMSKRSACICCAVFWPSSLPMPSAIPISQSFGKPSSSSSISPIRPNPSSDALRFFAASLLSAFASLRSLSSLFCSSSSISRLRSRSFSRSNSSFSCCNFRCARSATASFSSSSSFFLLSRSSIFCFLSFLCISNFLFTSLRLNPPSSSIPVFRPPSYFSSG
mmetsp:Transcript_38160/g.68444  ORF Transcript_38160/g.68444 Transcript_38160/m.68444 type:complete len:236 (+) Transcript_38160:658-1365(+)